ncbi:hypothetical protein JZ751_013233 [Albula glossodonta]|uniref:Uncharacterized protein n=1 Tax=Albula glossodonta TaxID=121402 RepID=A0A8T2P2I8_9TELE|nr:hypothetical protein JZ751_013233 [Albula glossodonta]
MFTQQSTSMQQSTGRAAPQVDNQPDVWEETWTNCQTQPFLPRRQFPGENKKQEDLQLSRTRTEDQWSNLQLVGRYIGAWVSLLGLRGGGLGGKRKGSVKLSEMVQNTGVLPPALATLTLYPEEV